MITPMEPILSLSNPAPVLKHYILNGFIFFSASLYAHGPQEVSSPSDSETKMLYAFSSLPCVIKH
jgi:hypothetical protein